MRARETERAREEARESKRTRERHIGKEKARESARDSDSKREPVSASPLENGSRHSSCALPNNTFVFV